MENLTFWIVFNIFVVAMLVLDLVVLNKKNHKVEVKEALWWTAFWISLALCFNGYLIEQSLSVDNLFVFMLVFSYFSVPEKYQRKVLLWGIIGALVFRAIFILVGVALIEQFSWTIYILGAFLVITGIRMAINKDTEINPEKNPIISLVNKFVRVSKVYDGDKFFTKINGIRYATPLFIVVLVIETTDIVFAADSIPAILAISKDPFIVYTSNVFALMGLRSLYFALAGIMQIFHYLHYGLSIILVFIGFKLLVSHVDALKIDMLVALGVVASILAGSIILSLIFPKKDTGENEKKDEEITPPH
jgi:tellurite resistance protein TerC